MNANELLIKFKMIKDDLVKQKSKLDDLKTGMEILIQTSAFLIEFSEHSREVIRKKLEGVVNSALDFIFGDKQVKFIIHPNKTKRGVQYDLYVETNGKLTTVMDAKGGGIIDVVTTSLRVAFMRMFKGRLRQSVILDEPFKNLSKARIPRAVEWLSQVSKDFGIQFIMVTHISEMVEQAENVIELQIIDGVTTIV